MLCLSRRKGETIFIGDHIKVVILGVQGPRVRLGIEAPDGTAIDREEVRIDKNRNRTMSDGKEGVK